MQNYMEIENDNITDERINYLSKLSILEYLTLSAFTFDIYYLSITSESVSTLANNLHKLIFPYYKYLREVILKFMKYYQCLKACVNFDFQ